MSFRLKPKQLWLIALALLLSLFAAVGFLYARYGKPYFVPNTAFSEGEMVVDLYPNTSLSALATQLEEQGVIKNRALFTRFAKQKGGAKKSFSGRYTISPGMTTRAIYNRIAGRRQTPVKLVIPSVRYPEELAQRIANQIALDSVTLDSLLASKEAAERFGFTVYEYPAMFIPNTYEVYWDITPEGFLERMHREYSAFWGEARRQKAENVGLTPVEVTTLASIIQEEVMVADELPIIAGVYINRLRKGMLLQACPTAKFAAGDFTITRVLKHHTRIESPYNTYLNPGLPPGPIIYPEIRAIDAVLNYKQHDYLFFCARDDFSGRHYFSRTNAQHQAYARRYQQALNQRGIGR